MSQYILRLDDASEHMDVRKWQRMELLLDKYAIKPLVGVIPQNADSELLAYEKDLDFWKKATDWQKKGWEVALHGFDHRYITEEGGLNPVNKRSEFAGVPLEDQKKKIREGVRILQEHGVETRIFFAPSHTFDENTLKALREESNIRIISDTVANDVYERDGFTFIPQQSGRVRKLPFKVITFCYHPNVMQENDFLELEEFLQKNAKSFVSVGKLPLKNRGMGFLDKALRWLYFARRR